MMSDGSLSRPPRVHNLVMRFIYWGFGVALVIACGSTTSEFVQPTGSDAGTADAPTGFGSADSGDDSSVAEAPATDVEAVITSDNAFSFGYGNKDTIVTYFQGEGSDGPAIFNCPVGFGPKAFLVPAASAPKSAYLYIVAWADESTTQGTLAQFKRVGATSTIYSGGGDWEVCAVGTPFSHLGPGPDQAQVNAAISSCNKGASGTAYSKGWVTTAGALTAGALGKLAFGESNENASGDFPIVCQKDDAGVQGIDAVARWMWFDPEDGQSPFVGNAGNRTKTFLVFRLAASALPPPPVK